MSVTQSAVSSTRTAKASEFVPTSQSEISWRSALWTMVIFVQQGIARRDRNLAAILPDRISLPTNTWLVLHEDLRTSRRLRLMMEHLVKGLREYAAATKH
jgi:hypothetical protein